MYICIIPSMVLLHVFYTWSQWAIFCWLIHCILQKTKNQLFECWVILHAFMLSPDGFYSFKSNIFKKFFLEYYQSVKQFGSRSGLTFCRSWFGPKLSAKVISIRHKTSNPGRSHTFVEINHEIISTVILLPSAESFKRGCCQLQAKVCAWSTG